MPLRTVDLTARLTDEDNNPLADKTINFYYRVSGQTQWTSIGSRSTDSNGYATISVDVTVPGTYDFRAHFPGDDQYDESYAEVLNTVIKARTLLTLTVQAR